MQTILGDLAMLGTALILGTVAIPRLNMSDMLCYLNSFFMRCELGLCRTKRGHSDYIFGCGALMPMELRRNEVRSDDRGTWGAGRARTALLSPMTPAVTLEDQTCN